MNQQEIRDAIEALDLLELSTKLELSEGVHNHVADKITVDEFFRAKTLAIAALRAQIEPGFKPKKLRHVRQFIYGDCSCGREVKTCEAYCCSCGQKLDWILDDRGAEELRNQKWDGE